MSKKRKKGRAAKTTKDDLKYIENIVKRCDQLMDKYPDAVSWEELSEVDQNELEELAGRGIERVSEAQYHGKYQDLPDQITKKLDLFMKWSKSLGGYDED